MLIDSEPSAAPTDAEGLFKRLKRDIKADYTSKGQTNWRKEAREDFDFEAGEQLDENDKAILADAKRPIVIFNRVGTTVDCVSGQEVGNRQEVQFLPRRQGVVKKNELLTSAAKWFRQQCDAEDEESDAFRDLVVCGMGWTETRLDYEDNPEGDPTGRTRSRWAGTAAPRSETWRTLGASFTFGGIFRLRTRARFARAIPTGRLMIAITTPPGSAKRARSPTTTTAKPTTATKRTKRRATATPSPSRCVLSPPKKPDVRLLAQILEFILP